MHLLYESLGGLIISGNRPFYCDQIISLYKYISLILDENTIFNRYLVKIYRNFSVTGLETDLKKCPLENNTFFKKSTIFAECQN